MNNSKRLLLFAGIICFTLSIFQIVIGFSPSLSLYFGAPESLVKNTNALIITSIIVGAIFALFGVYAFSGADKIIRLPWLKQILLCIGVIFLLRGLLLLPELLVVFNIIESSVHVAQRFIYFSIGALIIGFIFIKGTRGAS
ncbi:MAG: hypothetical protein ACOY4F_10550 [Thermodesulfobacteriota bacterium]